MATETKTWELLGKSKLDSINSLIPGTWRVSSVPSIEEQRDVSGTFIQKFLTKNEVEITETDAVGIVEKTSTGKWTAQEVATAFCHRASLAHQFTNCLHEIFFDAAIEDAKKLDEFYTEHKKPFGPLHGLPVSLKDQFHVKGVETTMGYIGWIGTFMGKKGTGKEKRFESEMVTELRALGAILYCKTSVPHTLMSGETVNNIIGYTTNPKNRNLSCGGSSGGEGALISLRGSPVGFGTDIGGSIRIPAAFNGLYGIRPSSGRLPYEGMANSMDGQNSVLSVVGPLSHSLRSLRLVVKSLLSQQPWLHDPLVHEIPWRDDQEKQMLDIIDHGELAFGIMKDDGVVHPHPPVRRAMDMAVRTLKKLGHHIVEWKPPSHGHGTEILMGVWKGDGGTDLHASMGLSGEPLAAQVAALYGTGVTEEASASKIAALNVAKREYQKDYMEYWNRTVEMTGTGRPVDAFILPVAPFAGVRPNKFKYLAYSGIVNTLDYTSCVVPVTTVDKRIDVVDKDFRPSNELDKDISADYDPEIYDGAHVAVQLVGRRLQEEKVLALAEHLGDALRVIDLDG